MRPPWSSWTLLLARERGQELNRPAPSCSDPTAAANPRWPDWPRTTLSNATRPHISTGLPAPRRSARSRSGPSATWWLSPTWKAAALLRAPGHRCLVRMARAICCSSSMTPTTWTSCRPRWCTNWHGRTARMIVTPAAGSWAAPEAIAALWTDGLLNRIDIEAPGGVTTTPAEVDEFLASYPGPPGRCWTISPSRIRCRSPIFTVLAGDVAAREAQDWGAAESRARGERAEDAWCIRRTRCSRSERSPRSATTVHDTGARRGQGVVAAPSASSDRCGWHRSRWTAMPTADG